MPSAGWNGPEKRVSPSSVRRARRCTLTLLALALQALALPAAAEGARPPARATNPAVQLQRASDQFREGRYAEARESFDALLRSGVKLPDRATIAFNAAVSSYALEEYADARRRFEAVGREAPELAALARVNAGFAALRLQDFEAARAYAEPTASSDAQVEARRQALLAELAEAQETAASEHLGELVDAGFAAIAREQWQVARAELSQALALCGANDSEDLADIQYGLGVVATATGEAAQAQEHFEQSLKSRPGDARVTLALARAAEQSADRERAEAAYETALALPLEGDQQRDAERSLFRLYPLPATGVSALLAAGVGADGNATQSGSAEVLGSTGEVQASLYLSGLVDLGVVLRASRRSAIGLNYSGDLIALLNPEVEELSLQAHQLVARWQYSPVPSARLRFDAGAAYLLTGLSDVRPFEWDAVFSVSAELNTGEGMRTRLQLGERLVRATELTYLDGHRLHAIATELWTWGAWELSLQGMLKYQAAGMQEIQLAGDAYARCNPNCDRGTYHVPQSYWSPGAGAGLGWQLSSGLRVSSSARAEYRGYLEPSAIPRVRASEKTREDWRFRAQLGGELVLDAAARYRLTLDQTLVVQRSNVAFDASDPAHQYDYADHNYLQPTTELGISASLP